MTNPFRRSAALALVALVAIVAPAIAQQETPASRQLARWLESFNAADLAAHEAFLKENYPSRAANAGQEMNFRQRTGGFTFIRLTETTPTRAIALLQERDNDASLVRVTVEVEPAAPHRVTSMQLQPGVPLETPITRVTSNADLVKAVKAEGDRRAAADRFSGAVMATHNGKEVVSGVWGLADRAKQTKANVDTRFRNGSMNKMFTAVAVLQLVQAGKVKLDAPIGTYLKDYPNQTVATKVTVHHLLTHTGGTGDIFGPQFAANRSNLRTHDDYLKLYGARDLIHEPGARFQYSNYGFVLAGLIVERVSGQSYYDYVRDHVFLPAGMTRTASEPESESVEGRAIGYLRGQSGSLQPNTETLPWRGTAAGGGYTTVGDLIRFASAVTGHKLLDAKHTDLLLTGKVDAFGGRYAYGFVDKTVNGQRAVGHGGGAPGMNGDLLIFPNTGWAVASLANLDPPAAERMSLYIANRFPVGATP
ncbi:MAG: serine hydrolase domain-containing protein [Gemmatimonadales bacterium]